MIEPGKYRYYLSKNQCPECQAELQDVECPHCDWPCKGRKSWRTGGSLERWKRSIRLWEQREAIKEKAMRAVTRAVKNGELIKPDRCSICKRKVVKVGPYDWTWSYKYHALIKKKSRPIVAHHWSYEPEHCLDVIWVCPRCHATLRPPVFPKFVEANGEK